MSPSTSPNRSRSAAGTASSSTSTSKGYDEERLEWGSVPRWATRPTKYLRLLRLRRVAFCLLVLDLMVFGLVVRAFQPLITLLQRNEELFGARLTLPLNDPYGEQYPDRHVIPRIFHQTAATDVIPEKWAAAQQSCKEVYHDFEYKLWTDETAREFISAEYPWFVETWDNYPFPIQRADAIRYFILYHYGGLYLDMDTICNATIPFHQIESIDPAASHYAVFKSTTPTGVSNDLLISSPRHPLFAATLSKLISFNDITRLWARMVPYGAIMIAAGPMFLTLVAKNYLLEQPSLPSPTVQVINATELLPYITDLESCSWHQGDATTLMWLGERPYVWYMLGAIGLASGLYLINRLMLLAWKGFDKPEPVDDTAKIAKLT